MANSLLDWTRALLDAQLFHPDGRIIGSPVKAHISNWEGYAAVSIAKASLESLAKYMAVEFAAFGLKTNLIQAGITEDLIVKNDTRKRKITGYSCHPQPHGPDDAARRCGESDQFVMH